MIVCVKCQIEMRVAKNEVLAVKIDANSDAQKATYADLWSCPDCGTEVLSGFAALPLAFGTQSCNEAVSRESRHGVVNYWLNAMERDRAK